MRTLNLVVLQSIALLRYNGKGFGDVFKFEERFDMWILHRLPLASGTYQMKKVKTKKLYSIVFLIVFAAIIGYGVLKSAILLADVSFGQWFQIGEGLAATALRVSIFLIIALAWAKP